jgi:hypothetical protein
LNLGPSQAHQYAANLTLKLAVEVHVTGGILRDGGGAGTENRLHPQRKLLFYKRLYERLFTEKINEFS